MTKEERQSIILELLIQHNSILVTDLATHLNVSSVTIRKDLTDLEREKKLYRNHGKAILIDPYIDNRNVSEKEKLYVEEKRLIGMKAASLITPKDSILIASGTTMHALARSIVPADELTVITASMEVSNILASEKNIYIIQLGGILRHSSLSVVGKYAENILADFFVQQTVYRRRRHRPRLRHHHYQYDGSEPQPRNDADCPENDSACGFLQVRTERFQQDCRYGRCRPHHYRLTHPAFHRFTPGRNGH